MSSVFFINRLIRLGTLDDAVNAIKSNDFEGFVGICNIAYGKPIASAMKFGEMARLREAVIDYNNDTSAVQLEY